MPMLANWKRLGSQTTDSNGRLTFQLPEESHLPVGLHRLQLVPTVGEPEEQAVELTLAVVPPNCEVVICSIDGSFAASLSLMGKVGQFVSLVFVGLIPRVKEQASANGR